MTRINVVFSAGVGAIVSGLSQISSFFSCTEFSEAFIFLMENIYLQFDDMKYQQVVGILIGTH